MRIAVTGSTGFVGSALVPFLEAHGGHDVVRIVRTTGRSGTGQVLWDPSAGTIDAAALEGMDAVVHLAGENIAAGRWTTQKKARILESRIKGTQLLSRTLERLTNCPRVLVSASAIGYYGHRGEEALNEESPSGTGFLPEVCQAWESATEPASRAGIRVVQTRLGVVLSPAGGALALMLTPFRLGLGGPLGSGRQYMSWVAIDDVVGAIHYALTTEHLRGPVNVVAPNPVMNREFTSTLARVLRRPAVFPVPPVMLRLMLGQLADEALLASARVLPSKLRLTGYPFRYPDLEGALRHLLPTSR